MIIENTGGLFIGRPNTVKTYQSIYTNWVENETADGIERRLNSKELKPRTKVAILNLFKKYRENEWTPRLEQLCKYLEKDKEDSKFALNKKQAELLMKECKSSFPSFYLVLLLSLHTGLRRGEVLGIRIRNIDLENKRILIENSYDGPTKSGKKRYVPVSSELEKELVRELNKDNHREKLFPKEFNPNYILNKVTRRTNLPKISFHQLRHTFATLALESGMSPKQVQAILGHSMVSTTLNLYWKNIHEETDLSFLP